MEKVLSKSDCIIFQVSDFIGKKWTLLIVLELSKGNDWKRYSQIKKAMKGITPKMLSARLKELTKEGIIEKKVNSKTTPIKSEYALTKSGKEFLDILESIKKWGIKNKDPNSKCKFKQCPNCKN